MTQFNSIAGFALGAPEMPESALRMAGLLLVDTLAEEDVVVKAAPISAIVLSSSASRTCRCFS